MKIDYGLFVVLIGAWALSLLFAAADNMFTVAQMKSRGFERGIPLTGHWTMLYLNFALPFLLAYLAHKYGGQWSASKALVFLGIGFVLSYIMHLTYIEGGKVFPEAPTYGGNLTMVGEILRFYMGFALAIIGLFYLGTASPSKFDVWLTTSWLIVHVIVGVHVPLKLLKPAWFPYHGVLDAGTLIPILGSAVVLVGLSLFALR